MFNLATRSDPKILQNIEKQTNKSLERMEFGKRNDNYATQDVFCMDLSKVDHGY